MKRSSVLSLLVLSLFTLAAPAQVPKAKPVVVAAPNVPGGKVILAGDRDQLRAGPGVQTARLHPALRASLKNKSFPVPSTWDWTKGDTIKLPMLGNDQWGDCYYVVLVKMFLMYYGNVSDAPPLSFVTADVVKRYLQLSGGDNGLSDSDVFPEIKKGVIGPNGPHKALDVLIVPASDKALLNLTEWAFGPHMFTFTVYSSFMNDVGPGKVIDKSSGQAEGGHAVPIAGRDANGNRKLITWGIQPSPLVTDHWISTVDPEFIAVLSLEWFNKKGYAPNGQHYNTLAPLWNSLGGHVPPVGPFPPPEPNPPVPPLPPTPPVPVPPMPPGPNAGVVTITFGGEAFTLDAGKKLATLPNGWTTNLTPPAPVPPTLEQSLAAKGLTPAQIDAIIRLIDAFLGKSGPPKAMPAAKHPEPFLSLQTGPIRRALLWRNP